MVSSIPDRKTFQTDLFDPNRYNHHFGLEDFIIDITALFIFNRKKSSLFFNNLFSFIFYFFFSFFFPFHCNVWYVIAYSLSLIFFFYPSLGRLGSLALIR